MRKTWGLLLAIVLLLAMLTACGSDDALNDLVADVTGEDSSAVDDGAASDDTGSEPAETDADAAPEDADVAEEEPAATGEDIYAEDGYGEGRMGDTMHTYFFDFTVNSAYTCQTFETWTAPEGSQLLVAEVTVRNTGRASIEMYDTDFQAQWNSPAEEDFRFPITVNMETGETVEPVSDQQLPGIYTLDVDASRTGLLVYEVPADLRDFSISYMEMFTGGETGDTFFVFFTADSSAQA